MPRRYGSFVVRCWRLERGGERIDVEHTQSGARTRVTSLAAALAWIEAHLDPAAPGAPDPTRQGRP